MLNITHCSRMRGAEVSCDTNVSFPNDNPGSTTDDFVCITTAVEPNLESVDFGNVGAEYFEVSASGGGSECIGGNDMMGE